MPDLYMKTVYHDPDVNTRLPTWNWGAFAAGLAIVSLDVIVPAGLSKIAQQIELADGLASVIVAGGVVGEEYVVTCRCVLASGESEDNSYRVICAQK